jgi:hypothetical protein
MVHHAQEFALVNVFCSIDKTFLFGSASIDPAVIDAALQPLRKATHHLVLLFNCLAEAFGK